MLKCVLKTEPMKRLQVIFRGIKDSSLHEVANGHKSLQKALRSRSLALVVLLVKSLIAFGQKTQEGKVTFPNMAA